MWIPSQQSPIGRIINDSETKHLESFPFPGTISCKEGTRRMNKTVLSFLAHPDDAEFLCTGTMIRLAKLGYSIHIASTTAGDCGTTVHDRWQISAIRTAENKKSAAIIGATYHCLGEDDLCVVYDKPTIRKAIDLFRQVAPSLVFAH